jgi:putative FmdB family regulatory protein
MPTYDYECQACNHTLEVFQGINEPVLTKCPACGKKKLQRQFGTGAAIVFKGSGFYQTDYRSESYKKAAKSDQSSGESKSSESKSAESKSSESKPAESKSSAKGESSSSPNGKSGGKSGGKSD